MESNDIMPEMFTGGVFLNFLSRDQWSDCEERSSHLTPLYIERFCGARTRLTHTYHDFWEISCVVNGQGQFYYSGGITAMRPGRLFLIPAEVCHDEYSTEMLDTIWIGLEGAYLEKPDPGRLLVVDSEKIMQLCQELWSTVYKKHWITGTELDGKVLEIFGGILRCSRKGESALTGDPVQEALAYFNDCFAQTVNISELALSLGVSEGHFHRLFKQCTGMTPLAYLIRIRIRNAAQWLKRTDLPVAQIADVSGFQDPYYFSRVFRQKTGMTPTGFRKSPETVVAQEGVSNGVD